MAAGHLSLVALATAVDGVLAGASLVTGPAQHDRCDDAARHVPQMPAGILPLPWVARLLGSWQHGHVMAERSSRHQLTINDVPVETQRWLRVWAAERGVSIQVVANEAFDLYIREVEREHG